MNLKTITTIKIGLLLALTFTSACTKGETSSGNFNVNQSENKSAANTASTPPVKTDLPKTSESAAIDLSTPTAAYKTAYAARKNKDSAVLKRVMSKDALEFMNIFVEPGKTIDDVLRQMAETPQASTDESRNEKITGDKATLEYPDAEGKWKTMDLVKENGEWKLTMPKGDAPGADRSNKSK